MAKSRKRLDELLVERGLAPAIEKARGLILAGQVLVNGARLDKPGTAVAADAVIALAPQKTFVGRGALKLRGALEGFGIDPAGLVCCDVGASTGGFTEVLLKAGAAKVYAIDVGYGELAWSLRSDPRVVVMERTNARYVEALPEPIDLAVIDVSFISLKLILPAVRRWLAPQAQVVALVKPQFEAVREEVPEGGIVEDPTVHARVLGEVLEAASREGMHAHGLIPSPITGGDGNVEFLAWLKQEAELAIPLVELVAGCIRKAGRQG